MCVRERGVEGVYAMEREMLLVSLYYEQLYILYKNIKFTVRNKYHWGHDAMQINVHTPPYNFVCCICVEILK